jgi:multidrug efflux pump subunit AcrA (membrane-fusion protein)
MTRSVWIPAEALSPMGQMERVFVIEGGLAELRLVKTGRHEGGAVQILSGIDAGERVVLHPPVELIDGQPVSIEQ